MPIFRHPIDDDRSFRMITSQFCVDGYARQVDIVGAFGVSAISVKRWVKTYRELGPSGFFLPRRTRGPTVLTTEVLASAQQLLDEGVELNEVARELNIKKGTLQKAVQQGRLRKPPKIKDNPESPQDAKASTKSERSCLDSSAPMGMGATNTQERIMASVGEFHGVMPHFVSCDDVTNGGLLFALPALLHMGLLARTPTISHFPKAITPWKACSCSWL